MQTLFHDPLSAKFILGRTVRPIGSNYLKANQARSQDFIGGEAQSFDGGSKYFHYCYM